MKHGLFAELKRRHVYRVAVAYAVVGWLVIQVAGTVSPYLHLPGTLTTMVIVVVALGFPIALILAWAFEVTPEGVRRTEPADSLEARAPEQNRKIGHTLDRGIIGVLIVAVALLAWRVWSPHKASPAPSPAEATALSTLAPTSSTIPAKSIAVLPFENLSTDKANAYFADGMQDLILTKLADIGDLKVISRTSTMQYGSRPQNLTQVGKQLGVATILEGSVQKAGDQVLINVQLIEARTDSHIWANSYQRTLQNVFGVEGEVARKIADALKAKLSPDEAKRLGTALSGNQAANLLYLQAEYFATHIWSHFSIVSAMKKAIPLYRKAVLLAPDFALARARLSGAESLLAGVGGGGEDAKTLYADALAQAELALKQDPGLAESHVAIGQYDYFAKRDYTAALKAFAKALRIRPNYGNAYLDTGLVLRNQGKFHAAIDSFKHALVLNPRSMPVAAFLVSAYMAVNQYSNGEQVAKYTLALDPDSDGAQVIYAGVILDSTGDVTRALAALRNNSDFQNIYKSTYLVLQRKYGAAINLLKTVPDTPAYFGNDIFLSKNLMLGDFYRYAGETAQARIHYAKALPFLRAHLSTASNNPVIHAETWYGIADAELGLGKTEAGLAAIKASLAAGANSKSTLLQPIILLDAAYVYAQAKRADRSVSLLKRALATPGIYINYSLRMLWLDPEWNPIRKSPAFRGLLNKYAEYRPAGIPAETGT